MNILEQIVADKRIEIELKKEHMPTKALEMLPDFRRKTISLKEALKTTTGIITEFKRKSPSKGIINDTAKIADVIAGYDVNGSAGMSVLTDEKYFGGTNDDIFNARMATKKPILRKDFMIDEYQIVEAKAIGADVILLIAACLTLAEVKKLSAFAKSLQLEVLLELHGKDEMGHVCDTVDLVGINNRDLRNFQVNWQHSIELAALLPADKPKIAESGIHNVETLLMLKKNGFDGFLIGENFMKHKDPTTAFADFVTELKSKEHAD